jgi:hypothetical protein
VLPVFNNDYSIVGLCGNQQFFQLEFMGEVLTPIFMEEVVGLLNEIMNMDIVRDSKSKCG